MKILHIIPNLRKGGAERIVIDIVREINEYKEHQVALLIFENSIEYEVADILELIHIVPAKLKLSVIHKNTYELDALQDFLDKYQPDVIHSHLFEAEIVSRSCNYKNAKWFSHVHSKSKQFKKLNVSAILKKETWTNLFEKSYLTKRYVCNNGTKFIAISKDVDFFLKQNMSNFTSILLANAIDFSRFKNVSKSWPEKPKLISIGSLNSNKNHKFLLQVMTLLPGKFTLDILGDGVSRKDLEDIIINLQLENRVRLLGKIEKVEDYLKEATIYVHSSKSEAFGLTLLEAMAAGLPVVSLDGGGNRDLILNGQNGFIIDKEDSKAFAMIIQKLVDNPDSMLEISQFAEKFAEKFDIKPYVEQLLALYKA